MFGGDDVIKVHPAAIGDYTHALATFSGELDEIANTALHTLAGIPEYFDTDAASMAYTDAQNLIVQGINEGKEVILRHGNAVDTASADYLATDAASANGFSV